TAALHRDRPRTRAQRAAGDVHAAGGVQVQLFSRVEVLPAGPLAAQADAAAAGAAFLRHAAGRDGAALQFDAGRAPGGGIGIDRELLHLVAHGTAPGRVALPVEADVAAVGLDRCVAHQDRAAPG